MCCHSERRRKASSSNIEIIMREERVKGFQSWSEENKNKMEKGRKKKEQKKAFQPQANKTAGSKMSNG
jgi:hypothetical protein